VHGLQQPSTGTHLVRDRPFTGNDRGGVDLGRVEDQVRSALADPQEARLLGTDVGLPLLLVRRTGWDMAGRPVEYTRSALRGDRFNFIAQTAVPQASANA
jgi:GntR family transcriptional regulator